MDDSKQQTRPLPDIRKTQVLNAPIGKVWEAVATADGIAAWWMPSDFEPVIGHEFHLDAGPYGKSPCKVTVVDPPHKVSFNWDKDWTLTFELKELASDQTEFTLIHSGWKAETFTDFGQPHEEVRETMSQGWSGICEKLARIVGN